MTAGETSYLAQAQDATAIKINVVQGEGQNLVIGSGGAKAIVVQVVDQAGKPVSGAIVNFVLGSGGTTVDGLPNLFGVSTNQQGNATLPSVRPTGQSGAWSIRVNASFNRMTATATVNLTNSTEAVRPAPS